jgi:hypothetical protein
MRWPFSRRTSDPLIAQLIVPPVVKFVGSDEALARRTKQRHEVEARAIEEAKRRLIEDAPSKIRLVNR